MAYNSFTYFLLFLTPVVILYYIFPKRLRWIVLLGASYVFYFIASGVYILFPLVTTVTVYACGRGINTVNDRFLLMKKEAPKEQRKLLKRRAEKRKKLWAAGTAVINISMLLFLKYFNFFSENAHGVLNALHIADGAAVVLKLILPLGISFYTLQAVGYITDVYRGTIRGDENFGRVALFIVFFPTVVEGPISRYDRLAPQIYTGHSFCMENFTHGAEMILWGLLKKVVIADRINMAVGTVFDRYTEYSGAVVAFAVLLYTIQIYCEFSGCMDMVSGSARLFGVALQKNFARPFFSHTVNEFWRRWHITLGAWLRDYVFYPISLSKPIQKLSKWSKRHLKGNLARILPTLIALFFVWFCNGFWHGANWKYIVYGLYYYALMTVGTLCEPMFKRIRERLKLNPKAGVYRAFQIVRTFVLVNIGMLIFRADSLRAAAEMAVSAVHNAGVRDFWNGTLLSLKLDGYDYLILAVGIAIVLAVEILQEKGKSITALIARQSLSVRWTIYFAGIFAVILFGAYGDGYDAAGFIYAQF